MRPSRRGFLAGALAAPVLLRSAPPAPACPVLLVEIRGFRFLPERPEVVAGQVIRFTNLDLAPHTATAQDGSWDTGPLAEGETVSLQVAADWGADFFCAFHPVMTGRLRLHPDPG